MKKKIRITPRFGYIPIRDNYVKDYRHSKSHGEPVMKKIQTTIIRERT